MMLQCVRFPAPPKIAKNALEIHGAWRICLLFSALLVNKLGFLDDLSSQRKSMNPSCSAAALLPPSPATEINSPDSR